MDTKYKSTMYTFLINQLLFSLKNGSKPEIHSDQPEQGNVRPVKLPQSRQGVPIVLGSPLSRSYIVGTLSPGEIGHDNTWLIFLVLFTS